jgi:hypothetical protein
MLNVFYQGRLPETSGFLAGPSGSDFAATQDRGKHTLDVVISLRSVLPFDGALHIIAHQKDAHMSPIALSDIHCEPKRVIRSLVSIGTIVNDEQAVCLVVFGHEVVSFLIEVFHAL